MVSEASLSLSFSLLVEMSLTWDSPPPCAATEIEGTFRVNGSNKRMRELQTVFETPPRVRVRFPSLTPTYPYPPLTTLRFPPYSTI